MRFAFALCGPLALLLITEAHASNTPDFDGVYRGMRSLTRQIRECTPASGEATVRIRGGVLQRVVHLGNIRTVLRADIRPDGSFISQEGASAIAGHVADGALEFDQTVGEGCVWHYTLRRQ